MPNLEEFPLANADYLVFAAYCALLCIVGYWVGRKEKQTSADYFLADRSLPWYVVGGSFITANISSEHFIGMIGSACVYGICVATSEWLNVGTFTLLIWVFIPFLLRAGVFTTAEFLEKRFHPVLRLFFAVVTVISNVTVFLAAVLYGGGLALQELFGWDLWVA
ncbi:MAG: Na+/glucose cotransporter, partial [Planctomycetes bacterium]|nr:Na+/glucose cotransporter [Planctomycetota bacterium]